jgi:short-subunit dehydrogenase
MTEGGVIINAASFAALIGSAGSGAYAASKAAVLSLTKTFAAELAPRSIRVNAYIPGVIATGMTADVIAQRSDSLIAQIAIGRLGTPGDVANAVVFLASDAAAYMTGMALEISGGKFCVQNPDHAWKLMAQADQEDKCSEPENRIQESKEQKSKEQELKKQAAPPQNTKEKS